MMNPIPLLVATQNKGKLAEYRDLLADLPVQILGTADVGLAEFDVDESGTTFEDNARLKAIGYANASGLLAIADDSGLAVDALDGRPGVYSARYGGAGLDDAGRRRLLLDEMRDIEDSRRGARFVCVIAVSEPNGGRFISAPGYCVGRVLRDERGTGGFGYDRLFLPDGESETFAELSAERKHAISHRGQAALSLKPLLAALLQEIR